MTGLAQNLRYTLRQFRKNPGFTAVAVITLALGIGPNVAMFSVIYATFIAPLPYPNGDQLVVIWTKISGQRNPTRFDDYLQYAEHSRSFQRLDFSPWAQVQMNDPDPAAEPVSGGYSMPGFFSKTIGGGEIAQGRDFLPQEATPGNDHVAIITHRLWLEHFHGDPNIFGKQIKVQGQLYTIVGVHKAGSADRQNAQFDIPFAYSGSHDPRVGNVFGRLQPGVTLAEAQAELSVIDGRLAATRGGDVPRAAWSVGVEPMKNDWLDRTLARNLWLLLGAVGFVLLIGCANLANLLLARAATRQREIAVRAAIGASRRQIFAQFLVESLTLSSVSGVIGVGLGWALLKLVVAIQPGLLQQVTEAVIEINIPVLTFAITIAFLAAVLFGSAPAWRAARLNLAETLNQGSQSVLGGRRGRAHGTLVVAEFALAITLLAGAGLAIHSFWKLTHIDLGFRADHLLTTQTRFSDPQKSNTQQVVADARQLIYKLRSIPGVRDVSVSTVLPLHGGGAFPFTIAGHPTPDKDRPVADIEAVTPSFFSAFGVRLLKGRLLNDEDTASSAPVVLVNDAFVRQYLRGTDPLTQSLLIAELTLDPQKRQWVVGRPIQREIVGIFQGIRQNLTENSTPEMYVSFWQMPWPFAVVGVRTALDPTLMTGSVRAAIITSGRPASKVDILEQTVDDQFKGERFGMALFGGFAGLAFFLAAFGIYGVMAFAVAQRGHEIGLRMAFGAQREQVRRMVLRDGLRLSLIGLAIGIVGVLAIGRLMRSTLYGVGAFDLQSFVAVALVLVAAASLASYIPARRADKVDPMAALRCE